MSGRKLIVFGGNGFVGSQVTKVALLSGWTVVVACRSGSPKFAKNEPWVNQVQYASVDALSRPQVKELFESHPDTVAVISCVGALTTDAVEARRMNGDATINMAAIASQHQNVQKFVFVSAADLKPVNSLLHGYYHGKRAAEGALIENLKSRSVILRPAMIYGSSATPLALVGAPLRAILQPLQSFVPLTILTPPISVDEVASAAVYACQEPTVAGIHEHKSIAQLATALSV